MIIMRHLGQQIVLMGLFAILHTNAVLAQSEPNLSAHEVLEQIRQRDELILKQGFRLAGTIRTTHVILPNLHTPGIPNSKIMIFDLTFDSNRIAWQNKFSKFDGSLRYVPPYSEEAKQYSFAEYDEKGFLIFSLIVEEDGLYEAGTINACRQDVKVCSISPAQALDIPQNKGTVLFLYRPEDKRNLSFVAAEHALLSTGRGFSYLLGTPISVIRRSDGLLELTATQRDEESMRKVAVSILRTNGRSFEGATWVLVVDPSADYLVREARYFPNLESKKPFYTYYTEGISRKFSFPIAEKGRIVVGTDRDSPLISHEFYYMRWEPSFDASLYQETRRRFFDPPNGTSVRDYRYTTESFIPWTYRSSK